MSSVADADKRRLSRFNKIRRKSLHRRDYIIYVLGSVMGAICGLGLLLIGRYLRPPGKPPEEPIPVEGWVPIAYTHEVPPDGSKKFAYGNIPGILINKSREILILEKSVSLPLLLFK